MNRRKVLTWTTVCGAVLLLLGQFQWRPAAFAIQAEIRTDQAVRLLVQYFLRETEVGYAVRIVDSRDGFTTVRFPVDEKRFDSFRLIQVDGTGKVWLRNLRVTRLGGATTLLPAQRLKPRAGVAGLLEEDGAIAIVADPFAGGTDIAVKLPKASERTRWAKALQVLLAVGLAFCCAAIVVLSHGQRNTEARGKPSARWTAGTFPYWVIGTALGAYFLASLLALNGSSSTAWRFFADRHDPDESLLLGTTKFIRSDEWLVQTPWILSQAAQRPPFPVNNPVVGEGPVPLITSLPVRHWSIIFRPQFLPFFFLPVEQGFAFYWNFKWFALFLGAFLFLRLVTSGNNLLALAGAAFVLFSGFVQWWFSSPAMLPEMTGALFFGLWAGVMIFRARSAATAFGAGVVLVFSIMHFVLCCYPRFQIPLLYLAGVVVLGLALARNVRSPSKEETVTDRPPLFSGLIFGGSVALAAILLFLWSGEIAALLREIAGLAYPGRVSYTGGAFPWLWHFAATLQLGMTEYNLPLPMANASEASGFVFLLPVLIAVLLRDAIQQRFDPLLIALISYLVALLFFMSAGIPEWLARGTGFWVVYSHRANVALGIGSAIALCRYLAVRSATPRFGRAPLWQRISLFLIVSATTYAFLQATNSALADYVSVYSVISASAYFGLLFLLIWEARATLVCVLLLSPLVAAHGLVNPVGIGLPGFHQSRLFQHVRKLHELDPEAKWLVLGRNSRSQLLSHLLKATGANVLGGTECNPEEKMVKALDPAGVAREVYSRYAAISFVPTDEPLPRFELTSTANYLIHLPTDHNLLTRLGVEYVVEVDLPSEAGLEEGFRQVERIEGCVLLKNDDLSP